MSDDPRLRGFLDRLASTDPVPAGGAAAAMSGAMGAALTAKIAGICLARDPEDAVRVRLDEIRARCGELSERLHALIEEDCAAFEGALATRDSLDDAAIRDAYLRACEPPRQIALHSAETAELAVEVLGRASRATRSDAAAAALLAGSACAMAADAVGANLGFLGDVPIAAGLQQEVESALQRAVQSAAHAKTILAN